MRKGLPSGFDPEGKDYRIYEGIDYKAFWARAAESRTDHLERGLISSLLPLRGRRIMDLGCGFGRLAPLYIDRYDQVILCDGSLSLLAQARKEHEGRALCFAGDVSHLPFRDHVFDCVLLIRVLQHVRDVERCFREAHRVLCRQGRIVFSYHNERNILRVLKFLLLRGSLDPFRKKSQELPHALLSHHPAMIDSALAESGFSYPSHWGIGFLEHLPSPARRSPGRQPVEFTVARILGRLRLAPWIFGRAIAREGGPMAKAESLEDLLQCPQCAGSLALSERAALCPSCCREYPIVDGIFDFRV